MLEFRILGPLEIWRGGEQVQIAAARERAIVAVLLLEANRVVATDRLIDLLWGDEDVPPRARQTLHTWMWRLRRRLEPPELFVTRPPGYLLRVQPEQVDLFRFEALLRRGRQALAAGATAEAAQLLGAALHLWRGQPLADVAAKRLRQTEGARLTELHLQAVEGRIEAELALGRHAELIGELRGLVADHPLREELCAHLMTALYRSGRQAEALDVFRALRETLAEQLGVEPGPAIQRLHRAALRADRALDPPPAVADPSPVPMTPAPGRMPAQLPADVSAFTGRTEHLDELDRLLTVAEDTTAIVISTIAGGAGVGKTALAVHWAHRVRDKFPHGQLYVNLRGYATATPMAPIEVLSRFLHALGVPAGQVPLDADEAADLYRTLLADRQVLVVLDNARDPDQVRSLLPGSPGCLVVVTSRDRLGGLVAREGAKRVTVGVLTAAEALDLLARTVGEQRLAAEPAAAIELTEACAYLPLALRIAAANLTNHAGRSIADYVEEVRAGNRLATLAVDGDERAAVRAAFDLSYQTLTPDVRRAFRSLGLVPGPDVTADAVAALVDTDPADAARRLDRLAAAHLVDENAPGRYTCHDLLRRYAAEQAHGDDSAADRQAAVRRLFDFYLHTADVAARLLYPEKLRLPLPAADPTPSIVDLGQPARALAWLDAERPNLLAAVRCAAEQGLAVAWLLADTLRGYFYLRMYAVDWLAVARAGLAAAHAAGDLPGQAAAHISLADLDWRYSRNQQAIDHYAAALAVSLQTGWLQGQASILGNLGTVYWQLGQPLRAADHYQQALAISRSTGWLQGQAMNLGNLASVCWQAGRLDESAAYNAEALALNRKVESLGGEAVNENNLGETYHLLGRLDEALGHIGRALDLHRQIGNRGSEAETLRCLAAVHRDAGRLDVALDLAQQALSLARDTGNRRQETDALNTLASVRHRLGDRLQAVEEYQEALRLARETNNRYPQAEALLGLAAAHRRPGQPGQAGGYARQALALAERDGYRILEGRALNLLAAAHLDRREPARAVDFAERAVAALSETGHRLGLVSGYLLLADARADLGDPCGADEHRERGRRLLADLGLPRTADVPGMPMLPAAAPADPGGPVHGR
jgi:DNA-binding SARP family transcriptional activator